MKKAFISSLIMTLMLANISLVNISSVQAATTDNNIATTGTTVTTTDNTIKVSLENIKDIMIENNLDIKIQHNDLEVALEEYHDARDGYDNLTEPTKPDRTKYADDATYNAAKDDYDTALNIYNTKKNAFQTKLDAYKTKKIDYDQKVETKVAAAQQAYINYLSNISDEKLKEDTVKINEKEQQVYKLQYESGFISKNDYISKLQKNTSANDLDESKDKEETARTNLCNTLGISSEENVTFNTDINVDFQVILKINYNDDLEKMLENNIKIKDKNDEIDDLNDAEDTYDNKNIYDYNVEKANNELKQLMNDSEANFKDKYNILMNSYNSIKSSYDKITQEQNEYQITQTKYNYGFVSQKEVDNAKLTLDKDNANFNTSKNTLYVNYLSYLQMKEGY